METWIIYIIAPIAIALVSWILGKNGRRIDETAKVVGLLQDEISRLTLKVEKLEVKLETKDGELERKSVIIQAAFECRTPSARCPVLLKQSEFNKYLLQYHDKGNEEQQSGEYPTQRNEMERGNCG